MAFTLRAFDKVLEDIQEARAWYSQLGIDTAGTRLETIEQRTTALLGDMEGLPKEEVVERWSNTDTYYALSDGVAFGRIAREIGKVGPNLLPRKKLRTVLEGPLVPADEIPGHSSVNARNIFTELELAAKMSECGIVPTGFDDLQFSFRGTDFALESKRLVSRRRVRYNVEEAYGQIQRRFGTDQHRGLISLALEKVMDLEGKILRVEPGDSPNEAVIEVVRDFDSRFGQPWQNFVDTRIVGILLIVRFLCFTVSSNVIGPAYYLVLRPLVRSDKLQGSDRELLLALANQLSTSR
jgi:hypothetical protein